MARVTAQPGAIDDRLRVWVPKTANPWPRRRWQWAKRYGHYRLMVMYRGGVRCRTRGSLEQLQRIAVGGRGRLNPIAGRCWIEHSLAPATAFTQGHEGGRFTRRGDIGHDTRHGGVRQRK